MRRLAELQSARSVTDALFRLVKPEALYERPIPERHRIAFYLGHLEAFDWNLLAPAAELRPFQPDFDRLFAFGIDPPPGRLPQDTPRDWPDLQAIHAYNARVRAALDPVLDHLPCEQFEAALEHRLMHAETFAYILHNLPYGQKVAPGGGETAAAGERPAGDGMAGIPAGQACLGLARGSAFGWDNEFEEHKIPVRPFAIRRHKVTNGDYLAFVSQGASAPHYWSQRGGQWVYRGMFGEIPLPLDWPVYATKNQAEAFAAWKGQALPTEPQFHRAAFGEGGGWEPGGGNCDFRRWDPLPVWQGAPNPYGVRQLMDNGWEWTSTPFAPFPGFQPMPFYPGYSANFFDGEHYVLKGASPRTAARMARPSFRNWFRPDYPYLYATFRTVSA